MNFWVIAIIAGLFALTFLIFAPGQVKHIVGDARQSGRKLRAGMTPDVFSGHDEYFSGLWRNVLRGLPDYAAFYNGGIAPLRRFDLVIGHTPFYHAGTQTSRQMLSTQRR